ncbi:MAG: Serine protein kinase [Parcubacteria group bacterium GW2011_GWF2_38_76]|nr:MAG: Serine protein kinase [Parcubacteria group bacterium GW2011_GWF2_38_76]HBM45965.1 hypothetical protein [Patescibacteria group bacterium]
MANIIDDLIKKDQERKLERKENKVITFEEYLGLLKESPKIAQFSAQRIFSMILGRGEKELSPVDREFFGVKKGYPFFEQHLKGVTSSVSEVMEFFLAGANGLALGKKVLLLFGPPASGKSSFLEILKSGLESYRDIPMYKIQGCPINEEPLHLLPQNMREDFERELGIKIKGDLCAKCRAKLEEYKEKGGPTGYYDIPVETFSISRRKMRGIGRFEPADEKAQDISDITAKENPAVTYNPKRGYDDPEAFTFNGAIPRGNRGLVEGVEFVKKGIDPKILWVFITLNEEGLLAVPGSNMAPLDIDTVVLGHCNIVGFKWFASDSAHEALQSRIYAIPFGYALRIKDEVEIYKKLINQANVKTHISPETLELVALFAISSRLNPDNNFSSVIEKAKFLNGQIVESIAEKRLDIKSVIERGKASDDWSKKDGMFGISPRDIMSALSKAIVSDKGCKCLTPKKAISFLLANFDNLMGVNPELIKAWKNLLNNEITKEYKERVIEIINTAFLSCYGDLALQKAKRYMKDVQLHCQKSRKFSAPRVTEENASGPDYTEMRKIETHMGLNSTEAQNSARGELLQMYYEYLQEHGEFSLKDFPKLREAVNKVLLEEMQLNMINILTLSEKPATGKEAENSRKHKEDLVEGLKKAGFCEHCVQEILEDARKFLKK